MRETPCPCPNHESLVLMIVWCPTRQELVLSGYTAEVSPPQEDVASVTWAPVLRTGIFGARQLLTAAVANELSGFWAHIALPDS